MAGVGVRGGGKGWGRVILCGHCKNDQFISRILIILVHGILWLTDNVSSCLVLLISVLPVRIPFRLGIFFKKIYV